MAKKYPQLYKETPAYETFEVIDQILHLGKQKLTDEQRFRLKSEALTLKTMLIYKLLGEKVANDMQKEIVENAKSEKETDYFRAVLADRRMFMQEIDALANQNIQPPKLDTPKVVPL